MDVAKVAACLVDAPADLYGVNTRRVQRDELALLAMTQQRLLRNNPREVTLQDAAEIYRQAL